MKKKILLELHKESGTNNLLLDSQDVFEFIGESTNEEMRLFYYIDKWCEWLNYYFTHTVTCNGNIEEIQLRSWLDGYNYAKQIDEQEFNDRYILVMRGYEITIMKPRKEDEKNDNNTCRGCVYENIDDTTEDISKCVCCKRNVDYAKNDYYTRKEDEGKCKRI